MDELETRYQHTSAYLSIPQHTSAYTLETRYRVMMTMRPSASSVWGLKLLLYEALKYCVI